MKSKSMRKGIIFVVLAAMFAVLQFCLVACKPSGNGGGNGVTPGDEPTEAAVTELVILKAPKKTAYVPGETFDGKGMVLRAVFGDGSKKTLTPQKCAYEPSGELSESDTCITFTYGGKSAVQPIAMVALESLDFDGSQLNGKKIPSHGNDFSSILTVTAAYADKDGEVISHSRLNRYELVFDYQPQSGENDKADFVFDDPSAVSGLAKGNYTVYSRVGDKRSDPSQNISLSVFGGFMTEAEAVYDTDSVFYGKYGKFEDTFSQYKPARKKPEDVKNYTIVESVIGWWSEGGVNDGTYGAETFIRPGGTATVDCSGGKFLGEIKKVGTLSVHFWSDIDQDVEIVMYASSAMIGMKDGTDDLMSHDIKLNDVFEIYIGADALSSEHEFDATKKLNMSDEVVLPGKKFEDGTSVDDMTANFVPVTIGTMRLQKGDNVIYFRNVFNNNESKFTQVKSQWLMNIDYFEVLFFDGEEE